MCVAISRSQHPVEEADQVFPHQIVGDRGDCGSRHALPLGLPARAVPGFIRVRIPREGTVSAFSEIPWSAARSQSKLTQCRRVGHWPETAIEEVTEPKGSMEQNRQFGWRTGIGRACTRHWCARRHCRQRLPAEKHLTRPVFSAATGLAGTGEDEKRLQRRRLGLFWR